MRFLVKVTIPVETGNAVIKSGKLAKTIESALAELKPEAAYFTAENGHRTAFLFLDIKDPSQIPAVAEPFFLAFNARVEFHPAMTAQDLMKAGPSMEQAIKKYG